MTRGGNILITLEGNAGAQVVLTDGGRGEIAFHASGLQEGDDLTLDIYPIEEQRHPDRHYGYWVFRPGGGGAFRASLDFRSLAPESVRLEREGIPLPPVHVWRNEGVRLEPIADFQVVARRRGKIRRLLHIQLQLQSQEEIERFYRQEGGGVYRVDAFNLEFHRARMALLRRLFRRFLKPGDPVLDAASGQSVFALLGNPVGARVFCLDIDFQGFRPRQGEGGLHYLQGKLHQMPFRPGAFAALFAGEAIEHLSSPDRILADFHRLLQPGGTLILTTPNAGRLHNRVRGYPLPLSREHVSERTLPEWSRALAAAGFSILHKRGIYLELGLTYWQGGKAFDWVRHRLSRPWAVPLIRPLMHLGRIFPSLALDLVLVAKKK